MLVPTPKNCDPSVKKAIQLLSSKLDYDAERTFADLTLSGLTASRLVATNSSKLLVSSDLVSWVTETTNQVLVADDGDGTITLSTPQDIHTGATNFTVAGLTVNTNTLIANASGYPDKVGIGTASPGETLEVAGNIAVTGKAGDDVYIFKDAGNGIRIRSDSLTTQWWAGDDGPAYFGTVSNDDFHIQTNNNNRITIKSGAGSGNVGIGTTSPKTKLTIEGTLTLKEQAAADTDQAAYGQLWVKTATPNTLWFTDDAGTDVQLGAGGAGHTIASHSDTTATGTELETLTDGSETALHSHAAGNGGGYVHRGDPSAYDTSKTDLTDDTNWNDLNLSGIVDAGAVAIHIRIFYKPTTVNDAIYFRKNGNSNDFNIQKAWAPVANTDYFEDIIVACDNDRIIEVKCVPKPTDWTSIYTVIRGWWL